MLHIAIYIQRSKVFAHEDTGATTIETVVLLFAVVVFITLILAFIVGEGDDLILAFLNRAVMHQIHLWR